MLSRRCNPSSSGLCTLVSGRLSSVEEAGPALLKPHRHPALHTLENGMQKEHCRILPGTAFCRVYVLCHLFPDSVRHANIYYSLSYGLCTPALCIFLAHSSSSGKMRFQQDSQSCNLLGGCCLDGGSDYHHSRSCHLLVCGTMSRKAIKKAPRCRGAFAALHPPNKSPEILPLSHRESPPSPYSQWR